MGPTEVSKSVQIKTRKCAKLNNIILSERLDIEPNDYVI